MYNQNRQILKSINMTEFMSSVSDLWFILFYEVISVLLIFLFIKIAENDATRHLEIPDPATVSPFDMALLANGTKRAWLVAVFSLWQKKKLSFVIKKNDIYILANPETNNTTETNKAVKFILEHARQERSFNSYFRKKTRTQVVEIALARTDTLKALQLYAGKKTYRRYWLLSLICSLLLLLAGGLRIYLAFSHGQLVLFPALLTIASVAAVFYFIKPNQVVLTALGRKFLKVSAARYEHLKNKDINQILSDDSLLYGIALYGAVPFIKEMPARVDAPLKTGTYNDSYNGETTGDTTL